LRNAQREASALRDAEVLLPVVDELVGDERTGDRQRMALVRMQRLLRAERRLRRGPGKTARQALVRHLRSLRGALARFERALPPRVGPHDLETGLGKSYRRAAAAFQRSRKDADDDVAFHDLRKATKVLHYQAELLTEVGNGRMAKARRQLSRLTEAQGRVTDLLLLRGKLAGPGVPHAQTLGDLLDQGIARRRRPAQRAARKLLSHPPRRFAHRLLEEADRSSGS
jgi:CHAD domain-containing protein